jgi:hypothetical protein
MKKLLLILSVLALQGCSLIAIWPKPHDPVMFDSAVSVKIAIDKVSCEDQNGTDAESKIHHLKVYATLRKDPQATSLAQLEEAIAKAKASNNKLFCEGVLKINKTRIDTTVDAWRGR